MEAFVHEKGAASAGTAAACWDLTDRELQVLRALARGLSNAEVGRSLFLSEATVKAHVSRLLLKLDATNRVQVAILAHDAGMLGG